MPDNAPRPARSIEGLLGTLLRLPYEVRSEDEYFSQAISGVERRPAGDNAVKGQLVQLV
jgi:hypothetical protein